MFCFSACAEQLVLPVLPDDTVCSVPSHCTAVDCCVEFPFINRNLNFKVDLNTCDYTLTISIENVEFTRMTFRTVWGKWKKNTNNFARKIYYAPYVAYE